MLWESASHSPSHWVWFLLLGGVLTSMAFLYTHIKRLPVTPALLYLLIGVALGPAGLAWLTLDYDDNGKVIEALSEIAVIVSLFTSGLKLRFHWPELRKWFPAFRLAVAGLIIGIALVAVAARWLYDFPWGAAILIGAILAPTDPVLASEVQVKDPKDEDDLRFTLTGEAGFNDGTAFPFVMLGLGLMGLHELGDYGVKWLTQDVLGASVGGLAIGATLGTLVARFMVRVRMKRKDEETLDDFLCLGLIALSYGISLATGAYGFLAVFAAGLAVRRVEHQTAHKENQTPSHMAEAVLSFNEQVERIGQVILVVLLGSLIGFTLDLPARWLAFPALLFFVIRPLSVQLALIGSHTPRTKRRLASWFGIRGIGSIYYLSYALNHGVSKDIAGELVALTVMTLTLSILMHGVSVTPLMRRYESAKVVKEKPSWSPR